MKKLSNCMALVVISSLFLLAFGVEVQAETAKGQTEVGIKFVDESTDSSSSAPSIPDGKEPVKKPVIKLPQTGEKQSQRNQLLGLLVALGALGFLGKRVATKKKKTLFK